MSRQFTIAGPFPVDISDTGSRQANFGGVDYYENAGANNITSSPVVGAATYTGPAPTGVVTTNFGSSPGVGAAVYTGFAPGSVPTGPVVSLPGVGALTYTGYAPQEYNSGVQTAGPGPGSLVWTGHRPLSVTVLPFTGMRTFSFDLLAGAPTFLVTITRIDDVVIRVTSWVKDIRIGANLWQAFPGLTIGQLTERIDGTAPSMGIMGPWRSGGPFDPFEVDAGSFENARIDVGLTNGLNPIAEDYWFTGVVQGAINYDMDGNVTLECLSRFSLPREIFVRTYQILCDADFGDNRCKMTTWADDVERDETIAIGDTRRVRFTDLGNPSDYDNKYLEATVGGVTASAAPTFNSTIDGTTTDGTVTWTTRNSLVRYAQIDTVPDPHNATFDALPDPRASEASWYKPGRMVVRSGPFKNRAVKIGAWSPGSFGITSYTPFGLFVIAGDWVEIAPDCNQTITMCKTKYDNVLNFRGFPYQTGARSQMIQRT